MKCPHCKVGIAEQYTRSAQIDYPKLTSLDGTVQALSESWLVFNQRCPVCHRAIIQFRKHTWGEQAQTILGYPHVLETSREIPSEVTSPFKDEFEEACVVLPLSAKASAALSRRLLQAILKEKGGAKKKDLNDQIDEVIAKGGVPTTVADQLHAVRNIGNFAAHPTKNTTTGEIIDVEPGEAEWNLDVLESLFDLYFVQPALAVKRKAELNEKLKAAGKPEIK